MRILAPLLLTVWLLTLPATAQTRVQEGARQGVGLRFGSYFNRFFRADQFPLVDGWWSAGVLGLSYKLYGDFGHAEFSAAFGSKGTGRGLPLVMRDYDGQNGRTGQHVSETFWQAEMKVGPRLFWHFYPKFGAVIGYHTQQGGYYEPNTRPADIVGLNKFYLQMPVGFSVDLPTSFGTTGLAAYYELGLTNTMRGLGWSDGSRVNSFFVELHVTIRTK